MSVSFQPLLFASKYNNQQLFSDYYLERILPNRDDWKALASEAQKTMLEIAQILSTFHRRSNERQTEENLIMPVLNKLGYAQEYEVQAALKTPDGTKAPDYIFYRDQASLRRNKGEVLTDALPHQGAFAVADAKRWERPLDKTVKLDADDKDFFTNKNPSYQIAFYIHHSGLDWGILTNGRKWRLYHKSNAQKLDRYYEVDLLELVQSGDPLDFLYFYTFFRRAAFDTHTLGIDAILEESIKYARAVGDTLKLQVYDALRHVAQGFLDYSPNGLSNTPDTLKEIYDASLIVLYRMLFILYAEARDLLPLDNPDYQNVYSFKAIKEEAARNLNRGTRMRPGTLTIWPKLKTLFGFINEGDEPLRIATFNGGLFDSGKHPFLEKYAIGDSHLQKAIDKLARIEEKNKARAIDRYFVDYRDLAVRHLGTIYEGLLEYHLEPAADGEWSVDLLTDKGERKATGSYYTPDYIVNYIVKQALEPVLLELLEKEGGHLTENDWAARVLSVNVLDPAMGSGHFLVEATEYIARFMVEWGIHPPDIGSSESDETDIAYWKRRVAQSCIYGVDLNPLAVELAKLSLWLATVAKNRPLSFLDHHLRVGNSLVGARLSDLRLETNLVKAGQARKPNKRVREAAQAVQAGQHSMLDDSAFTLALGGAVGSMWEIEENPGLTIQQVKAQEAIYSQLRESLTSKYGRLADFVTATHFGLKANVPNEQWSSFTDYATGRIMTAPSQFERWLAEADKIAQQRHFLHWELEFPEVFFDRQGLPLGDEAGFDAVIGNPPYFNMQTTETDFRGYIEFSYAEYCRGKADVYYYFMAQANRLTRIEGLWSMITARYFIESFYADKLWVELEHNTHLLKLFDFGTYKVFKDAGVDTAITLARRTTVIPTDCTTLRTRVLVADANQEEIRSLLVSEEDLVYSSRFRSERIQCNNLRRTKGQGTTLDKLCYVGKGAASGCDQVFVVDTKVATQYNLEQNLLHLIAEDESIDRYQHETEGRFLVATERGTEIDAYPNTHAYLQSSRDRLEKRYAVRNEGLKWFEIVRYNRDLFDGSSPQIFAYYRADHSKFSYSEVNLCSLTTTFVITLREGSQVSLLFLLTLLNSRYLQETYFRQKGKIMGGVVEYSSDLLSAIPIPAITFTTPELYRRTKVEQDYKLYEHALSKLAQSVTSDGTNFHLSNDQEESDVLHDLLARLSRQMINLTKQRKTVVEDFLLDLEGILPIAQLQRIGRLWTPLPNSAGLSAEARAQLGSQADEQIELRKDIGKITEDQWKWLLKGRLKKIASLAELVRVYRNRQPSIAELDRKIAFTDDLIDQIVYRLYGLTEEEIAEEEIAIVEGR